MTTTSMQFGQSTIDVVLNEGTALVKSVTGPNGEVSLQAGGYKISSSSGMNSITGLPSLMAFGNSVPRQNQVGASGVPNQVAYNSHLWWALAFSGQPFSWVQTGALVQIGADPLSTYSQGIYGYGGATSTTLRTYFPLTVGIEKPAFCFMEVMENDITAIVSGSMTRAEAKANYLYYIQSCLSQGTAPIWLGCLPSKSYNTAPHAAEYWALTDYVESLQGSYPGMIYVPMHDLYMDSSINTPQPLSSGIYANYTDTSVHPYAVAPLIGTRIADVLAARNISGFGLIPGPGDARYVAGNAYMSGTGGTVSASLTAGTCPTNLTINSNAAAVGTPIVADYANKQALEIPIASGTSTGLQNMWAVYTASLSLASLNSAVGDTVQLFNEVTIDPGTTLAGLRDLYNQLIFTGGTNDAKCFVKASGTLFDTITIPTGRKMLIATPLAQIPASTTALRGYLYATASNNAASLTGKFWMTKFSMVNWSKTN